ncbi:MAG: excisionase family DNA-binding protein [Chloroflexota bacterium]
MRGTTHPTHYDERGQLLPVSVSVDEAARALGVTRAHLHRKLAAGEIKSFKLGRRRLVPYAELQRIVGEAS